MIDKDLHEDIRREAAARDVRRWNDSDANDLISKCAEKFVGLPRGTWWWQSLSSESRIVHYGDGDGLEFVRRLMTEVSEDSGPMALVPTDDEPPPWPVFAGAMENLFDLVEEVRYFEYFLTDLDCSWMIFDTHHNDIVVCGALVGRVEVNGAALG